MKLIRPEKKPKKAFTVTLTKEDAKILKMWGGNVAKGVRVIVAQAMPDIIKKLEENGDLDEPEFGERKITVGSDW